MAQSFIDLKGESLPEGWEEVKEWNDNLKFIFLQYFYQNVLSLNDKILNQLD
jgi:hypothetical protein